MTVITGRPAVHEIVYQHGAPHERTINVDGNPTLTPIIAEYQRRNRNGTYRHYHMLNVPCPDGNHHKRIALFHTDATDAASTSTKANTFASSPRAPNCTASGTGSATTPKRCTPN